jgi:hypothetical protein
MDVGFEAGQVWERIGFRINDRRMLLHGNRLGDVWQCEPGGAVTEEYLSKHARLIAPAPKHGQRWSGGGGNISIIVVDDGTLVVESDDRGALTAWRMRGSVVEVARWLLTHGYKRVASAPAEIKPGLDPCVSAAVPKLAFAPPFGCTAPVKLQDGDIVRSELYSSTGRVNRPSASHGADLDIGWTSDGGAKNRPFTYGDSEVSHYLANGSWKVVGRAILKPHIELRDGMRISFNDTTLTAILLMSTDGWYLYYADCRTSSTSWSRERVLENIETGKWTVLADPPIFGAASSSASKSEPFDVDLGPGYAPRRQNYPPSSSIDLRSTTSSSADIERVFGPRQITADIDASRRAIERSVNVSTATGEDLHRLGRLFAWTREDSRRAVDAAVAKLRGEPFARAIQAVLVAAADLADPTRQEIDAIVAGCQAWEERRSQVAPGRRALTDAQRASCTASANDAMRKAGRPYVSNHMGDIYERARGANEHYRTTVRQQGRGHVP